MVPLLGVSSLLQPLCFFRCHSLGGRREEGKRSIETYKLLQDCQGLFPLLKKSSKYISKITYGVTYIYPKYPDHMETTFYDYKAFNQNIMNPSSILHICFLPPITSYLGPIQMDV